MHSEGPYDKEWIILRTFARRPLAARTAAAVTTGALVLLLGACGSGSGSGEDAEGSTESGNSAGSAGSGDGKVAAADSAADDDTVLATVDKGDGVKLVVNSAVRDDAGFVTVSGKVKNGSGRTFLDHAWTGNPMELDLRKANGMSMAGASLVDKTNKKRYLVLKDTSHKCLCTKYPTGIKKGATVEFYAQFPAPPKSVGKVDFQVPTLPTATVALSSAQS
ncbi:MULTISPECIES: hypothetical protein [unclassified Streptomyces]|uniref:hypothetical protein n=1 Tax=unclassified Streptomyces TaxID=2593676 RepID=UPI00278BBC07|nr:MULTISPECIES: hypothetical protein [unclassified Streptomyces]